MNRCKQLTFGDISSYSPFERSETSLTRSVTSFAEGNIIYAMGGTSFICALLETMLRVIRTNDVEPTFK